MSSSKSSQVHQPLLHYNEQLAGAQTSIENLNESVDDNFGNAAKKAKKKTSCSDYLKRFDQLILRPILIHKYEKDKEARAQEFYEMFQEEGQKIEKLFREQQKTHANITATGSDLSKTVSLLNAAATVA